MEGEAFLNLLPRLTENTNIYELVKDGDLQIDHIIKKSRWNVKLTPDLNHELKHFSDHFDNLVNPNKHMFRGICPKILKQFKYILYSDTDKQEKYKQIQEMKKYILTQPFLKLGRSLQKQPWKYANDKTAIKSLDKVIDFCNQIASTFDRGHSTCFNENFHSLKANYLLKNYNLGNTADVRVYASILHFNNGRYWVKDLYSQLNLPVVNVEVLEEFHSRVRPFLKEKKHDLDYIEKHEKEEEQEYQNYIQLQIDKENNIPIHK